MSEVLKVKNLRKSFRKSGFNFKKTEVLKGFSFNVEAGKITGFLGANGAGKTTTIKCLLGLAHADEGTIEFFGQSNLTHEIRSKIGFLPERPYFYEYLTGTEFLRFYGEISTRLSRHELDQRIEKLLGRVGLATAKDRQLRNYSKGMLQRVGIAQALIHNPEFIILDEPMTGLDPDGRWEVNEIIKETAHEGTAVFFSTHQLNDAEKICENIVVLKHGELIYSGATQSFLGQVNVRFQIQFRRPGASFIETMDVIELPDVQRQIDQLRKENCEIHDLQSKKISLEEAFVKVAFGDKAR